MRKSGVLMHVSSLPSPYGIGTFGRAAFEFADFLSDGGQSCWLAGPLAPTGFGDSPYQPLSGFAGNPLLIDLDTLASSGFIDKAEFKSLAGASDVVKVDYFLQYKRKLPLLRKAAAEFLKTKDSEFESFCEKNAYWLGEYSLFAALREKNGMIEWGKWTILTPEPYECELQKVLQFFFFAQWSELKNYCNSKGVEIIGSLPFFLPADSAEAKYNPSLFPAGQREGDALTYDSFLKSKANKNPDKTGYDWDKMGSDGYSWWIQRLKHSMSMFDRTVLDFCGKIDISGAHNPLKDSPQNILPDDFFKTINKKIPNLSVIFDYSSCCDSPNSVPCNFVPNGETLKFPMIKKMLSFFESREKSDLLAHSYEKNCLLSAGLQDDSTILGWASTHPSSEVEYASEYLRISAEEGIVWGVIKSMLASAADTVVLQMQDLLSLDDSARMNNPEMPYGNWRWRAKERDFSSSLAAKIRYFTRLYGR